MLVDDGGRRGLDVFRFVAVEAGALDCLLDRRQRSGGEGGGIGIFLEKIRRDDVYSSVGALGGEDRRNEKLKRRAMDQCAVNLGIFLLEGPDDLSSAAFDVGRATERGPST